MTTGSQKWLPKAAALRTRVQHDVDRRIAKGIPIDVVRRQAAAAISLERLPRLLEQATYDSLKFTPLAKGQRR